MKVWIITEEITDYDQEENPYKSEDAIIKVFNSKEKADTFNESKNYIVHELEVE